MVTCYIFGGDFSRYCINGNYVVGDIYVRLKSGVVHQRLAPLYILSFRDLHIAIFFSTRIYGKYKRYMNYIKSKKC